MNTRKSGAIGVCCLLAFSAVGAADTPPSESSIKQLLEVSQVHRILDTTLAQMDGMMKQAMQQVTQGQTITPETQKDIDKRQTEMVGLMKEMLDWDKLQPVYVRVYQKSLTQPQVDSLIAMYKSPGGQTLLNTMPTVMQNTMTEMQQIVQPMIQRMQKMQQDVVGEIQADKKKSGG